jgi:hypothetical protein
MGEAALDAGRAIDVGDKDFFGEMVVKRMEKRAVQCYRGRSGRPSQTWSGVTTAAIAMAESPLADVIALMAGDNPRRQQRQEQDAYQRGDH